MTWNYRIIRSADECALHEVYYDDDGEITASTESPCSITGEEPQDIIEDLEMMLADALRLPTLNVTDLPA